MSQESLPAGIRRQPSTVGDEGLYLEGSRCRRCGAAYFPARAHCVQCVLEGTTEPINLGNRGTLHAFTVVHVAPPGFTPPYALGYVDLPAGVRLMAHLDSGPAEQRRSGAAVRLTVRQIGSRSSGEQLIHYAFRIEDPAEGDV